MYYIFHGSEDYLYLSRRTRRTDRAILRGVIYEKRREGGEIIFVAVGPAPEQEEYEDPFEGFHFE